MSVAFDIDLQNQKIFSFYNKFELQQKFNIFLERELNKDYGVVNDTYVELFELDDSELSDETKNVLNNIDNVRFVNY